MPTFDLTPGEAHLLGVDTTYDFRDNGIALLKRVEELRAESARLRADLAAAVRFEDDTTGAAVYPHGDAWITEQRHTGETTEHDDVYTALEHARRIAGEGADRG